MSPKVTMSEEDRSLEEHSVTCSLASVPPRSCRESPGGLASATGLQMALVTLLEITAVFVNMNSTVKDKAMFLTKLEK